MTEFLYPVSSRLVGEREDKNKEDHKTDEELQFNLQLLAEVISVKNVQIYRYQHFNILVLPISHPP